MHFEADRNELLRRIVFTLKEALPTDNLENSDRTTLLWLFSFSFFY